MSNKIIKLTQKDIQKLILDKFDIYPNEIINSTFKCDDCIINFIDREQCKNFYLNRKTKTFLNNPKDEYLKFIHLGFPASLYQLLKDLDIPFIRKEYYRILKHQMEKEGIYDLTKLNKKKIIGKYISTMYLKGFMPYNFEDTSSAHCS